MGGGFFGGFADDGEVEAFAACFGDFAEGMASSAMAWRVEAAGAFFIGEAVEGSGVEAVDGGPAVLAVPDVATLFRGRF